MGLAAKKACLGVVELGAGPTAVGELRSWDLNEDAAEVDVSTMGACDETTIGGRVTRRLEIGMYFASPDDATQALLLAGAANMVFIIKPFGTTVGLTQIAGTVNVLTRRESGDNDGAVELNVTGAVPEAPVRSAII